MWMRYLGGIALVGVVLPVAARGATPETPQVQQMIGRGAAYLEKAPSDGRLGGKCVAALALLKAGRPITHPKVAEAIKACRQVAQAAPKDIHEDIYSTGLAIIFLAAADASKYRGEIVRFLQSLELRQKGHGGWGYPQNSTGDTSMTQYATLASWEARAAGVEMPIETIEKVANWLIRTQDPRGVWGYQGNDPGNYTPVQQAETRPSMGAAGLGSVIICADLLGLIRLGEQDDGLPPALKLVADEKQQNQPTGAVEPKRLEAAIAKGQGWFEQNFTIRQATWQYYYLYTLERAMSFLELAHGQTVEGPVWYNEGVKFLAEAQADNGSWQGNSGPQVATAFAMLFLLRSTRKSIEHQHHLGEGVLVGGRGLPSSLDDAQMRRGRIVDARLVGAVDDVMKILADPTHPDFDYIAEHPELLAAGGPSDAPRRGRLERLVRGGAPEARRAAVWTLGRSDDLDVVPTLVFALSDPDWRVVRAARDALRLISRKFAGFGLPDRPTAVQAAEAAEQWKAWYLTIRPDAVFEESAEFGTRSAE